MAFYLNSYHPLCLTVAGRDASRRFGIDPFVDGSIRREPDLEHDFPAITCLCRGDRFAPRLDEDDRVAYMTTKQTFGLRVPHRRLTAVLRPIKVFDSHEEAADWYRERQMPLPNNCLVPGNRAKPLNHTHQRSPARKCGADGGCGSWDGRYWKRARRWGTFVICEKLFCDLSWEAPVVEDADLIAVFGNVPGTRNPGGKTFDEFLDFMAVMGIDVEAFA